MDLLPKTIVSIRSEARSTAYRTALQTEFACCFGFLLGNPEPFTSPVIEFSLVGGIPKTCYELRAAPAVLRTQLAACGRVAEYTGTTPFGIFFAWDSSLMEHRNQFLGLFVDAAQEMKLRYFAEFPTLAHEPNWAPIIYFTNRFPHDPLPSRSLHGKLSIEPRHNPRRVRVLWHEFIMAIQEAPE